MKLRLVMLTVLAAVSWNVKSNAQFQPTDALAVLRIGNNSALSSVAVPGSIYQFSAINGQSIDGSGWSSNYSVSSSSIVDLASGTGGIVFSGNATAEGGLSRAKNSSTLLVGGYSFDAGTALVVPRSGNNKTVARIDASGGTTYQLFSSSMYTNNSFRSVASIDGERAWFAGASTSAGSDGIRTAVFGDAVATSVSAAVSSTRAVGVFGTTNTLFFSAVTGAQGIYVVGDNNTTPQPTAPTSTSNTATLVIANASGSNNGFWMTGRGNQNYLGTGLDTAYLLDGQYLRKYEFDGNSWVTRGSLALPNPGGGASGTPAGAFITGRLSGGSVTELYITLDTVSTSNNYLVKLTDSALYGSPLSGVAAYDWSVAAGANYSFRGLDFTPVPEPQFVFAVGLVLAAVVGRRFVPAAL